MKNIVKGVLRGAAIAVGGGFVIGATATVLGISPAHADTSDSAFLSALASQGITSTDGKDYMMVRTAHLICEDMVAGTDVAIEQGRLEMLSSSQGGHLPDGDAYYFVRISQVYYCPGTLSVSRSLVEPRHELT
jgi:hypothetical protein